MSTHDSETKILRASKTFALILAVIGSVFTAIGARQMQTIWPFSSAHVIFLIGALGLSGAVQQLTSRIVLLSDKIEFGSLFSRTSIAKVDIESVTWEKGCGVSLRMKNQSWRRIPDLGNAQGVCNSIRAWLKR